MVKRNFYVTVSQNGGEYYVEYKVVANNVEIKNINSIIADGVEIEFEYEYVTSIRSE